MLLILGMFQFLIFSKFNLQFSGTKFPHISKFGVNFNILFNFFPTFWFFLVFVQINEVVILMWETVGFKFKSETFVPFKGKSDSQFSIWCYNEIQEAQLNSLTICNKWISAKSHFQDNFFIFIHKDQSDSFLYYR